MERATKPTLAATIPADKPNLTIEVKGTNNFRTNNFPRTITPDISSLIEAITINSPFIKTPILTNANKNLWVGILRVIEYY